MSRANTISKDGSSSSSPLDLHQLLAALAAGARAVQGLPTSKDDLNFESSFPEFKAVLKDTQSTWLDMVQNVLQHPGLVSDKGGADNNDESMQYDTFDDPLLWDECADLCEALIEQISDLNITGNEASAAVTLQNIEAKARANATSQWSRMKDMLVSDLPKPQDIYPHLTVPVPENHRTIPFIPPVHPDKPFGITPLPKKLVSANRNTRNQQSNNGVDYILNSGHGLDTRFGPLRSGNPQPIPFDIIAPTEHCPHLYETEINSFQFTEEQLKVYDDSYTEKNRIPVVNPLQAIWVDTVDGLEQLNRTIIDEKIHEIAVDLEAHSYRSFSGLLCLMQITVRSGTRPTFVTKNYLIDTLLIKRTEITRLMAPIFANPSIVKVFHGADHDVAWLQRDFGIYVVNMFDTGRAARSLSFTSAAFAYLLKRYCANEIVIDKSHQLADWRQRPLTNAMQQYAIQDTHYLLDIYDALKTELYHKGGVELIEEVLNTSRKVCLIRYSPEPFKPSGYKQLICVRKVGKGRRTERRSELNDAQENVCRALWDWRDQMGRKYDESLPFVCSNHALLRLSLACPTNSSQLNSLFHPLPTILSRHSQEVLNLVKDALRQPKILEMKDSVDEEDVEDGDEEDDESGDDVDIEVNESGSIDVNKKRSDLRINRASVRDEDDEDDEELMMPQAVDVSSSSVFFKPARITDQGHLRRAGMMSPVLGTEALYMQAGWMTPQEQQDHRADQVMTTWEINYHTEPVSNDSAPVKGNGIDQRNDNKTDGLLPVHVSNTEYASNHYMEHTMEVGNMKKPGVPFVSNQRNRTSSLDGMETVRAAADSGNSETFVDDTGGAKNLSARKASRIQNVLKDSVPIVLNLVSRNLQGTEDSQNVSSTVVEDDDGTDDGGVSSKSRESKVVDSKNEDDENEAITSEEFFVIPRSIREIYKISNRNRRNKKTASPTPEPGANILTEKEQLELKKAEKSLKERTLVDKNVNTLLFEDENAEFSPGKRPRAKSGRESEESVPDKVSNVASKEEDLNFMKEIGWLLNDEEVDTILSNRYGKGHPDVDINKSDSIHALSDPVDNRKDGNQKSSFRGVTVSPADSYSMAMGTAGSTTTTTMGLIPTGQPLPASNPFFSGAAMMGGPLTQQGFSRVDTTQRGRQPPGVVRGKPNRTRQQERPEKRGDRTHSYRSK